LDILGAGTFGQVVKCQNLMTKQLVGVKVVKNKPAYLKQSLMEVDILKHVRVVYGVVLLRTDMS
jgi:dual specificity protein kinase YAK1